MRANCSWWFHRSFCSISLLSPGHYLQSTGPTATILHSLILPLVAPTTAYFTFVLPHTSLTVSGIFNIKDTVLFALHALRVLPNEDWAVLDQDTPWGLSTYLARFTKAPIIRIAATSALDKSYLQLGVEMQLVNS